MSEATRDKLTEFFRNAVRDQGSKHVRVTIDEIRQATHLSQMTVHRGLRHLVREGLLTVVHPSAPNRAKTYIWIDELDESEDVVTVNRHVLLRLNAELRRLEEEIEQLKLENQRLQQEVNAPQARRA